MSVLTEAAASQILELVYKRSKEYLEQAHVKPVRAELGVAELRNLMPSALEQESLPALDVVNQLAVLGLVLHYCPAFHRAFHL